MTLASWLTAEPVGAPRLCAWRREITPGARVMCFSHQMFSWTITVGPPNFTSIQILGGYQMHQPRICFCLYKEANHPPQSPFKQLLIFSSSLQSHLHFKPSLSLQLQIKNDRFYRHLHFRRGINRRRYASGR
jgi:hypothetical protein